MKIQFLLFVMIFLLSNCKINYSGRYISRCWIQTRTELFFDVKNDSTFQYFFAYHEISDEEIKGKWEINKDTLILFSPKFLEKRDTLSPIVKNTDLDSLDQYLIRGRKLYPINKIGVKKTCYLVKAKKR